jgi:hypothetical protein
MRKRAMDLGEGMVDKDQGKCMLVKMRKHSHPSRRKPSFRSRARRSVFNGSGSDTSTSGSAF